MSTSSRPRVLFCSYHSLLDPSSGAAVSTRDLLALLAARGWACGAVCGPDLDHPAATDFADLARAADPAADVRPAAGPEPGRLAHLTLDGVPITVYAPDAPGPRGRPTPAEGEAFLGVFDRVRAAFRPDVLLTYGGHWLAQAVMARARAAGVRVVFTLRNFAYTDAAAFRHADAVLVPSAFARDHYRRALGIEATAIPGPFDWSRFACPAVDGRYVTLVNPQPAKGGLVLARVAHELGRRRPDVRFLVVEGRGGVGVLGEAGLDLTGLATVSRMPNTRDPRAFLRVTRVLLVPSLWREAFGRVAVEAMANGIPVVASRSGGLPEALNGAGVLLDLPAACFADHRRVPTAEEVAPWVAAVERLWDDPDTHAAEGARCRVATAAWHPDRLVPMLEAFLRHVWLAPPRG